MAEPATTVLLLADYGGPYRGSFIPAVQAVAREVRARGWSIECGFTPVAEGRPWLQALAADGIEVRFAPQGGRRALREWLQGRVGELEGRVVLHTHFTGFDLPAAAVARGRDGVVLWHVHSFLPSQPLRAASATLKYGWLGRRVSRFVCAGEGPARSVRRRGARSDRVTVLLNGVETERFRPITDEDRARARSELGLPTDSAVLLHFGWDWQVKGGPLFGETLARLRGGGADAIGMSVGAGAEAEAAAHRLGLGKVLLNPAPAEDVRRFYAAADALLATSADEGSPFSILEAISCGLPVVASDIPGHRLGDAPPPGLRLAPADSEALAAVAGAVLERSPDERQAEAGENSAWIAANRSLDGWARRVAELYEEALEAAASSGKAAATSGGSSAGQ